jgi:hypothetical protein
MDAHMDRKLAIDTLDFGVIVLHANNIQLDPLVLELFDGPTIFCGTSESTIRRDREC